MKIRKCIRQEPRDKLNVALSHRKQFLAPLLSFGFEQRIFRGVSPLF